jgi:hypothetical protein
LTNGFNGLLSLYENLTHSQQLFCPKLSRAMRSPTIKR